MTTTTSAHTDHCYCTSNTAGQRCCCQCGTVYEITTHVTFPAASREQPSEPPQSVAQSCECPARPGEPCPLSEAVCVARCRSALAKPYLATAMKLSNCLWRCHQNQGPTAIGIPCSVCKNIALGMVDAVVKARGEWLAESAASRASVPGEPPQREPK